MRMPPSTPSAAAAYHRHRMRKSRGGLTAAAPSPTATDKAVDDVVESAKEQAKEARGASPKMANVAAKPPSTASPKVLGESDPNGGVNSFVTALKRQNHRRIQQKTKQPESSMPNEASDEEDEENQGVRANRSANPAHASPTLAQRRMQQRSAIFKAGKQPEPSIVNGVLDRRGSEEEAVFLTEKDRLGSDEPIPEVTPKKKYAGKHTVGRSWVSGKKEDGSEQADASKAENKEETLSGAKPSSGKPTNGGLADLDNSVDFETDESMKRDEDASPESQPPKPACSPAREEESGEKTNEAEGVVADVLSQAQSCRSANQTFLRDLELLKLKVGHLKSAQPAKTNPSLPSSDGPAAVDKDVSSPEASIKTIGDAKNDKKESQNDTKGEEPHSWGFQRRRHLLGRRRQSQGVGEKKAETSPTIVKKEDGPIPEQAQEKDESQQLTVVAGNEDVMSKESHPNEGDASKDDKASSLLNASPNAKDPTLLKFQKKRQMFEKRRQLKGSTSKTTDGSSGIARAKTEDPTYAPSHDDETTNGEACLRKDEVEDDGNEEEPEENNTGNPTEDVLEAVSELVDEGGDTEPVKDVQTTVDVQSQPSPSVFMPVATEGGDEPTSAHSEDNPFVAFEAQWEVAPTSNVEEDIATFHSTADGTSEDFFDASAFDGAVFDEGEDAFGRHAFRKPEGASAFDGDTFGEHESRAFKQELDDLFEDEVVITSDNQDTDGLPVWQEECNEFGDESLATVSEVPEEDEEGFLDALRSQASTETKEEQEEGLESKLDFFKASLSDEQLVTFSEIMATYGSKVEELETIHKSTADEVEFLKSEMMNQHDQILKLLEGKDTEGIEASSETVAVLKQEIADLSVQLQASEATVLHLESHQARLGTKKSKKTGKAKPGKGLRFGRMLRK